MIRYNGEHYFVYVLSLSDFIFFVGVQSTSVKDIYL